MKHITFKGTKKGTIVYVHGNSSSFKVFSEPLKSKKIKYSQIAVQLPGHEDFEQDANFKNFSMKKYTQLLKTFVNTIDDDILLVGNSLGGHIAIEIAHKIKKLKGLVIFGTPPLKRPSNFEEAFLPCAAIAIYFREQSSTEEITESIRSMVFDATLVSQMAVDFNHTNPKVRGSLAKDLEEQNFENEENIFVNLDVPKYILVGDNDPCVNPKYLFDVCEKTKQNCTQITLKNCGHYPSLEKPKEFIEIMNNIAKEVFN